MHRKGLYAIQDKTANDLVGQQHAINITANEAVAVRLFTDVANMKGSMIAQHPSEFALVRLGWIESNDGDNVVMLTGDYAVILEGSTWAAAQTPPDSQR